MNGLLAYGFGLLLFTQSAKFENSDCSQQNEICGKRKSKEINDRAEGERNDRLNVLVYEQVGRLMRTDIEHIEGFLNTCAVYDLVEDHGNSHRAGENGHRSQDRFMLQLDVTAVEQIDRNRNHGAMANGGLDIDADCIDVDIVGNAHRDESRKHGVSCEVSAKRIVNFALFDHTRKQTDVHRRGAKLEGERIPLIIKSRAAAERKIDLLVNFQNRNDDRNGKHYFSYAFGLVLLM